MTEYFASLELVPSWGWILAVLAIAGCAFMIQRWLDTPANRHRREALKLFYELCRAHRLDHRAVRTLMAMIQGNQLEHPALIFIRPDLFVPEKLSGDMSSRIDDVKKLRRQLFVPKSDK